MTPLGIGVARLENQTSSLVSVVEPRETPKKHFEELQQYVKMAYHFHLSLDQAKEAKESEIWESCPVKEPQFVKKLSKQTFMEKAFCYLGSLWKVFCILSFYHILSILRLHSYTYLLIDYYYTNSMHVSVFEPVCQHVARRILGGIWPKNHP